VGLGLRQAHVYCRDVVQVGDAVVNEAVTPPGVKAINGLGLGLGAYALGGANDRDGRVWDYGSIGRILAESGVTSLDSDESLATVVGLVQRLGGLRRIDQPLFSGRMDGSFWSIAGAVRDWRFLPPLFQTKPSDLGSDSAARQWLDAALKSTDGDERGLALLLAKMNYYNVTGGDIIPEDQRGRGVFARYVWQGAMVKANAAPGCLPVELSLGHPVVELSFTLDPAAANCLSVHWSGPKSDDDLPPVFTVVADGGAAPADALDGLHLTADQSWSQSLTIESGTRSEVALLEQGTDLLRPGLIVEDSRSGKAVKVWEVILKPDEAFADDRMTIALTNLHPGGEASTKPVEVKLTVGPGAHEARQQLQATAVDNQRDPCVPQVITPDVPGQMSFGPMAMYAAALDTDDFSINLSFLPPSQGDLMAGYMECARIQMAVGLGGGSDTVGGRPAAGSPTQVCAGRNAQLAGIGAAAMAAATGETASNLAGLEGLVPSASIEFGLDADRPITGPGTYPATATATLSNATLEQRGLDLPSSVAGRGTITIEQATPGFLRVSYQARLEHQEGRCTAQLVGPVSGTFQSVVAMPMLAASRRTMIAPRAIEFMGEKLWSTLSASQRAELSREPRREVAGGGGGGRGGGGGSGGGASSAPIPGLSCNLSEAETRRLLNEFLGQLPPEVRREMEAQIASDPEMAKAMACMLSQNS